MTKRKNGCLLGIDFGGGASKATLIDFEGSIIAEAESEYPTLHPELGACEQSPDDWISALKKNTHAIIEKSGIRPSDIAAIAVDSATHTFIPCDGEMMPLYNAVHWTDTRSKKEAEELRLRHGDLIFKKTYHLPDTIWTLPQLLWLKGAHPDIFKKTEHILFEKDYIRYFLTGVLATDSIEAQGSMLYSAECGEWCEELCALASIKPSMLPPIKSPTDTVGSVTREAAAETGLAEGTAVICGTTDTALEVFASGAVRLGDMTVKLATAGRICIITDRAYPDRHLVNYPHVKSGLWYPGSAAKSAASSFRWYRDTFGGDYRELDLAAAEIPVGCEGLMFHPYINGELTPYADPELSGSFIGIRSTHTRAHFSRAVLEGVGFSLLDGLNYLEGLGIPHNGYATLIGGGAKSPLWRQIIADMLGLELKITESSDSSLGAAMLAGVAAGVFDSLDDARDKCIKELERVFPNRENHLKYKQLFAKYKKIHDALAPIYHEKGEESND